MAAYGDALLDRLAKDLNRRLDRFFSCRNLQQMRLFYQYWPIVQTLSAQLGEQMILQTLSAKSRLSDNSKRIVRQFLFSWSYYARLVSVEDPTARAFYETEALVGQIKRAQRIMECRSPYRVQELRENE